MHHNPYVCLAEDAVVKLIGLVDIRMLIVTHACDTVQRYHSRHLDTASLGRSVSNCDVVVTSETTSTHCLPESSAGASDCGVVAAGSLVPGTMSSANKKAARKRLLEI